MYVCCCIKIINCDLLWYLRIVSCSYMWFDFDCSGKMLMKLHLLLLLVFVLLRVLRFWSMVLGLVMSDDLGVGLDSIAF